MLFRSIDLYKKYLKDSDISENLYYTVEADIQKLTDRYVELVDLAVSEKNEELMEI